MINSTAGVVEFASNYHLMPVCKRLKRYSRELSVIYICVWRAVARADLHQGVVYHSLLDPYCVWGLPSLLSFRRQHFFTSFDSDCDWWIYKTVPQIHWFTFSINVTKFIDLGHHTEQCSSLDNRCLCFLIIYSWFFNDCFTFVCCRWLVYMRIRHVVRWKALMPKCLPKRSPILITGDNGTLMWMVQNFFHIIQPSYLLLSMIVSAFWKGYDPCNTLLNIYNMCQWSVSFVSRKFRAWNQNDSMLWWSSSAQFYLQSRSVIFQVIIFSIWCVTDWALVQSILLLIIVNCWLQL